jgi:hypothetical protein
VTADDVEALVGRVEGEVEAAGGELPAERLGELCLEGLGDLDQGAYMQFAGTLPTPPLTPIRPEVPSGSAGSMLGPSHSPVGTE